MYKLTKKKISKKFKFKDNNALNSIDGFIMNKSKAFVIEDTKILNINVVSKEMAYPLVIETLNKKYSQLIKKVMTILTEDDDSGDGYREALNQIERFKLIIKNKYMEYLDAEMLKEVARQLTLLQKEVNNKLLEIQEYYSDLEKAGKSR